MSRPRTSETRAGRGMRPLAILVISVLLAAGAFYAVAAPASGVAPRHDSDALTAAKVAYADRDLPRAEEILRRLPGSPAARALLGRVLTDRGHLAEAREIFNALLAERPQEPEALWGMARVSRGFGRPELAISYAMRAAQVRKTDPMAWRDLGLLQRETGDALGALASLQQSLTLDPAQADLSRDVAELASGAGPAAAAPQRNPLQPRPVDPRNLTQLPRPPDPTRHFPRPGGIR